MRRDKIYWLYQRQALLEQFQHLYSHLVGVIPKESDLVGKEEHVVCGHQLKNIEGVE
jgi:hypothetical protein